jgi:hypothetical protein
MTSFSHSTQRNGAVPAQKEWLIDASGVTLSTFKETLSHWALAGSPSTLLRSERDCEVEYENFHIATIKSKEGLIYGYVSYLKFDPGPLEEALDVDEQGLFETYTDKDGRYVSLSELKHFDVFEEYSGRAGIVYINKIEVMTPGLGLGEKLLHHILDAEEPEICFLHAIADSAEFFLKMGFETTGIRNGEYHPEAVLALHKRRV